MAISTVVSCSMSEGKFVEGYYIVGLTGAHVAGRQPGGRIVHDPRLVWNTVEEVVANGGKPVQCKTGHAFIKERMRAEDAVYGGEMSAHHYFRDFNYCDSGMIPWLLVAQLICKSGKGLALLLEERIRAVSGQRGNQPTGGRCGGNYNSRAAALRIGRRAHRRYRRSGP